MKRYHYLLALAVIVLSVASCAPGKKQDPVQDVNIYFHTEADSLEKTVQNLADAARKNASAETLRNTFASARNHFKKIESLVMLAFPEETRRINGPAIVKAEEYDDKLILPTGFQVLEETLYANGDSIDRKKLLAEALALRAILGNLKALAENTPIDDAHAFEAMRLEILTISSLGISGFDSPISFQSIHEAQSALEGIETLVYMFQSRGDNMGDRELRMLFGNAYQYLEEHSDFDSFNRADFIRHHLNKLSAALYRYQKALGIPNNPFMKALDMDKPTFFDKGVFRPDFFAPGYNTTMKPEVPELGKLLFFDPILSGNNSRACASCHIPGKAFTDGHVKSVAFNFEGQVARNAPTLINSAFQRSQFWDQRIQFTEHQVSDVMANPSEMHGHIKEASEKISKSQAYRKLFQQAFGEEQSVTERNIQTALATYIRSLSALNAPFDRYMRGDSLQLDEDQLAGFNLFMGKGKCGTCHFAPLFNGTVLPLFGDTEAEVLGVPSKPDTVHATVDPDPGKFNAFKREPFRYSFKTPTVRNAALTAPYMHNGVYKTLEEVVDFYNRGGGAGIGISLPNQTLPPDPLHLSSREQKQIVAFIHSLTDTTGLTRIPMVLPVFGDKVLDGRKVGGKY